VRAEAGRLVGGSELIIQQAYALGMVLSFGNSAARLSAEPAVQVTAGLYGHGGSGRSIPVALPLLTPPLRRCSLARARPPERVPNRQPVNGDIADSVTKLVFKINGWETVLTARTMLGAMCSAPTFPELRANSMVSERIDSPRCYRPLASLP
jgi:hypothetical protein